MVIGSRARAFPPPNSAAAANSPPRANREKPDRMTPSLRTLFCGTCVPLLALKVAIWSQYQHSGAWGREMALAALEKSVPAAPQHFHYWPSKVPTRTSLADEMIE
jgi:hypothetical protein